MKTTFQYFFILVILFAITISACKKDEDDPFMTAKVGSNSWTALVRTATYSQSQDIFIISGFPTLSQSASQSIVITIRGGQEGTYRLSAYVDEMSGECMLVYKTSDDAAPGSTAYYNAYSAVVVITELDQENKKITGTFNADMYPNGDPLETKLIISEGKFDNLSYSIVN